ncbi:zinc finger protein 184 [Aedes aegypti]|uniref:Uncharacterized protein n=1 Tax=Aedes aegypti TaxID=7159 RepID=A0A6I8TE87_AEDAE|nr:zinc finger protein 184 [Aedes aegypti]
MEVCRLCATVLTESTSIFSRRHGDSLADMVRFVSAVQINETDGLTSLVCADCVELTVDAFHFVKRVREVDENLRQSLLEAEAQSLEESRDPDKGEQVITPSQDAKESDLQVELHPVQNDIQFDMDEISVEYLEEEPEDVSKKLISLLIESVNEFGSDKWIKIEQDLNYEGILHEQDLNQAESDEEDDDEKSNSDEERLEHIEPRHIDFEPSGKDQAICCGCEANFGTVEELYQHGVDQHLNQPSYPDIDQGIQCNICYKYFKTKTSLRNHQVLVYKPKIYSCHSCGKAFECPSKLANHELIHTTERNFACSVCGGTFKTATDLRGHQRIHQEKSAVCSVCGAKFHKKSHLRSHLKTHDDNAYEFACSLCPKKFKEKSNWKNHLKVHTQEKPYKCEYCPKEFRYTTDRKRHEMTHTGNYPHRCTGCGKAFARGNLLQVHIRVCGMMHEK